MRRGGPAQSDRPTGTHTKSARKTAHCNGSPPKHSAPPFRLKLAEIEEMGKKSKLRKWVGREHLKEMGGN